MKNKKLGKILIGFISACAVTFSVVGASACTIETSHPRAEITYEFNGQTYEVSYTLYRNMYPHTVRHFIELAENNFYDDTVIHNYTSNDWFTGGYGYDEDEYAALSDNASQMTEYLENYSKEDAYMKLFNEGKLTPSVYATRGYKDDKEIVDAADALPTVMGEFYENIHQEIEKGALSAEYGSLKMFYYEKKSAQKIYVTPTSDQIIMADYKTNCATSLFALQTGTSSSYNANNYTVFARLDSTDEFDDFVDAVRAYITDNHGGTASNFYSSTSVRVDNLDDFSNKSEEDKGKSVDFNVPKTPIIIRSVKITQY